MNIESFKIYFPLVNTSIESLSIMLEFLKKTECEDSPFNLAIYSNFLFYTYRPNSCNLVFARSIPRFAARRYHLAASSRFLVTP